jgi:cobalt-zinc-cadmium efflux system protein
MNDRHHHDHDHDGHDHGGHDHAHHDHSAHHHGHSHPVPARFDRAFAIGTALNVGFVAVEFSYGVLGNSLALIADAGHNLSDVAGLLVAWGSSVLARRLPTARYTYGLRGTTILAALGNAALLFVVTGAIAWEAILRFMAPQPVATGSMIVVAAVGIAVNGVTAWLFQSGSKSDLNLRGAYLHMAADAAVSAGVVVAGVLIAATGWLWVDPAVTLVISAVIVVGTWDMLRQSTNLALDAVPAGIDPGAVRKHLQALPGVASIHDLHIWAMSTTETALTCHLIMPAGYPGDGALACIADDLKRDFAIGHATIQVEDGKGTVCALEPDHVV